MVRMRRLLAVPPLLLLACAAAAGTAWQPIVLRTFDGGETQGQIRMLAVPENRDAVRSRLIRVAVVRLPGRRAAAPPTVFLSGGPGIPATTLARVPVYHALFERLRESGDVLLVDQRGSGMSLPNLTCPESEPSHDFLASDERLRQALLERVGQCTHHWRSGGVDLRGYSTREIAGDVDAARRAAGAATVHLLAFSYGSEVAFEVLRRWPATVGRVVFASTRGPDTLLKSPAAWDRQLDAVGALAAVPLRSEVEAVVARLDREPVSVRAGDASFAVGGIGVLTLLRNDLPDGRAIGNIPSLVRAVAAGNPDVLTQRVQQIHASLGKSFNLMTLAVDCSSGWSPDRLSAMRREAAGAVMRNVNLQWDPGICALFGGPGAPPRIPRIETPALFITGTLDPSAPLAQTERIRRRFTNSVHVVVENGAHETLPARPVQDEVVRFLGGSPAADKRIVLPSPFDTAGR